MQWRIKSTEYFIVDGVLNDRVLVHYSTPKNVFAHYFLGVCKLTKGNNLTCICVPIAFAFLRSIWEGHDCLSQEGMSLSLYKGTKAFPQQLLFHYVLLFPWSGWVGSSFPKVTSALVNTIESASCYHKARCPMRLCPWIKVGCPGDNAGFISS